MEEKDVGMATIMVDDKTASFKDLAFFSLPEFLVLVEVRKTT